MTMSKAPLGWVAGVEAPRDEELYRCVHCGLCLSACPTYMATGLEAESPRGRLALMKAVREGRVPVSPQVVRHWDLCLQCRACEAVCPSAVPYGRLMEYTRAQVVAQGREPWRWRLARWGFLRAVLPRLGVLYAGGALLRLYQRSPLRWLARAVAPLRALDDLLPPLPSRFFRASGRVYPAAGVRRSRVALLAGCVMAVAQGPTMEASVRVLQRNGCEVAVPAGQGCCGALSLHGGDLEGARRLARRTVDALLAAEPDYVVVASAGCGSTMKEYGELLRGDAEYAARAEALARRVVDVTELLAKLGVVAPRGRLPRRVTYQDPCHLVHAQRISKAPREVLGAIPGVELVEMEGATMCCGAAGLYTVTNRGMSRRLLEGKMEAVAATGAEVVATANPGCMLQLQAGVRGRGLAVRVAHVVDLLDEAYREEG